MPLHFQSLPACQDRYSSVALKGLMIGVMTLSLRKRSPEVFSGECAVDSRMASIAPRIKKKKRAEKRRYISEIANDYLKVNS